jgi:hypothetical protein
MNRHTKRAAVAAVAGLGSLALPLTDANFVLNVVTT